MEPITDQDLPQEGIIENEDGSVDITELLVESSGTFQDNLADVLDESELTILGQELCEAVNRDKESRNKRDKQYEEGLRRTGLGDDAPGGAAFSGASDVVHPVMAEACVDFAARAIKELFPPQGPVKTSTIGAMTEEQLDVAERKRLYLNWQLTDQMPEYRSELEQLLTQLPLGGSQFQKFWHDDRFNRPVSEFVPIDDILLPYAATSFYTAQRVTHVQHITKFEFEKRVRSGLYRDAPGLSDAVGLTPEQTSAAVANDKIEGKEEDAYNEDGLRNIYEIYAWEDLGDELVDGDSAPYIITVDEYSEKVLGIYRNWSEDDEKLEKLDWMVEWKFIPWRGAYAIGFPQLIGSLSAAATGSLRALLDAAHINNLPGLIKLKGNATTGKNVEIEATGVSEISGPPGVDDIRKLLMPMPFNPPSQILFQLLGWLTDAAKGVVRTAESAIANAGDRTPVGTTQAMIEQGSTIYSAIHARLHESQKKALKILSRINGTWLDEEQEVKELGKLIIRRKEFSHSLDVMPVSDPAIFSEAQRYAQNQSLNQLQLQDAQDPSIPWNKIAIRRRLLKQMRIDNVDEILPLPPKPITADPMTEIMTVMSGGMIKATLPQDHMAHIQSHLLYMSNPVVINNPLVPGQPLSMLLQHVQQHINLLEQMLVTQASKAIGQQAMQAGQQITQDQAVSAAMAQTAQRMVQMLTPFMQRIQELQPLIQAKMPQPQSPPEVQASLQIAKMDTDRKTNYDNAMVEIKKAEVTSAQELDKIQLSMDQQQNQFDQWISQQEQASKDQNNKLKAQLDLMMNRFDNEQKQVTELLKNRDDNDTKVQIALQDLGRKMESTPNPTDFTSHIGMMQGLLDQMNQQKTGDALSSVIQGLQATIQSISRPRRVVLEKDANGNAISALSTLGDDLG